MLYCNKCKVSLPGSPKRCPLCQGDLKGEPHPNDNVFPVLPFVKPHKTLLTWVMFGAVAVGVISVSINLSFPAGGWWSLFVLGGIASLWISFITIVKKRSNIPKSISWQVAIITVLSLIWDFSTGFHGWSIDFVIPIFCTCAMVSMAAIAQVLRLEVQEYMVYLLIDGILGVVSFILIMVGALRVVYPSAICFACSVISLAALVIFERKALLSELHRRTHI